MGVLTAADIAGFRALNTALAYHDVCEVLRTGAPVRQPSGEFAAAEYVVATAVPCSLDEVAEKGEERVIADRLGWAKAYQLGVPYDLDVTPRDRVRMLDSGRVFEVGEAVKAGQLGIEQVLVLKEIG